MATAGATTITNISDNMAITLESRNKKILFEARAFAAMHVREMANELAERRRTSILAPDAKIRQLASILAKLGAGSSLVLAENVAIDAIIDFVVSRSTT